MSAGSESAISSLPPLREIIDAHGLRARKALGQNFLLELNLTGKIAHSAGVLEDKTIIEIGPGPGGLTRALLLAGAKKVVAVEFDSRAVAALQSLQEAAGNRLEIIEADALAIDPAGLAAPPRAIVANLPYNIATPLLTGWLKQIHADPQIFSSMTLMFQKEVAQRLCAGPGSKAYGRLAVLTGWLCRVRTLFDIPPSAFTPPPKVTSSVVNLVPVERKGPQPPFRAVEKVTAAAFGQRRKMVRSSLRDYAGYFDKARIDPHLRAEELPPEVFLKLALLAGEGRL